MTITAEQFAAKLDQVGRRLGETCRDGVNHAGGAALAIMNAEIASDIGPESRMSGLGRAKFKADGGGLVTATLRRSTSTVNSTAYVGPWGKGMAGAFGILEGGARPHVVGAGRNSRVLKSGNVSQRLTGEVSNGRAVLTSGRLARSKGYRRVYINGNYRMVSALRVSGAPAKRTISRAANRSEPIVKKAIETGTRQAVLKAFR